MRKAIVLMGTLALGMALASNTRGTNLGTSISESLSSVFCPIIKLIAGPLFWGIIGVLVMVGLIMMASASRGFGKYFLYPIVAAVLFAILKSYITSQATSAVADGNSVITNCLGWQ